MSEIAGTACAAFLGSKAWLLISAGTLAKAWSSRATGIGAEMATLVAAGGVEVVPLTAATAARVAEAHAAWGRGNHLAMFNVGDRFIMSWRTRCDEPPAAERLGRACGDLTGGTSETK